MDADPPAVPAQPLVTRGALADRGRRCRFLNLVHFQDFPCDCFDLGDDLAEDTCPHWRAEGDAPAVRRGALGVAADQLAVELATAARAGNSSADHPLSAVIPPRFATAVDADLLAAAASTARRLRDSVDADAEDLPLGVGAALVAAAIDDRRTALLDAVGVSPGTLTLLELSDATGALYYLQDEQWEGVENSPLDRYRLGQPGLRVADWFDDASAAPSPVTVDTGWHRTHPQCCGPGPLPATPAVTSLVAAARVSAEPDLVWVAPDHPTDAALAALAALAEDVAPDPVEVTFAPTGDEGDLVSQLATVRGIHRHAPPELGGGPWLELVVEPVILGVPFTHIATVAG